MCPDKSNALPTPPHPTWKPDGQRFKDADTTLKVRRCEGHISWGGSDEQVLYLSQSNTEEWNK